MVQASVNNIVSGTDEDKLNQHRAQRLMSIFSMTDNRARTIAALAWESAHV